MLGSFIYNLSVYGGISLTLFLIFLLCKDFRQLNKRILIGILLHFLLLFMVYAFISEEQAIDLMPFFLLLLYTLGPLIFTYVDAVYNPELQLDRAFYKRLLPASICGILLLLIVFSSLEQVLQQQVFLVLALTGMASLWWFSLSAYRQLGRYRKLLRQEYANMEDYDLHWLSNWMRGLLLLLAADIVLGVTVSVVPFLQAYMNLSVLAYALFIVYIGYQGLMQDGVLLPPRLVSPATAATTYTAAGNAPSSAVLGKPEQIEAQIKKLEQLLQKEELFRQESLNLRYLASKLELTDKQLSTLLNQHLQTNFYEYINQYRVAAFKEAVQQGKADQYTLLAIALNCGFSSKSSFNRIFKQYTGLTPSAFKRELDSTS